MARRLSNTASLSVLASLGALFAVTVLAPSMGCSTGDDDDDMPTADGGQADAMTVVSTDGAVSALSFKASNIDLTGVDLSGIGDADITSNCVFQFSASGGIEDCTDGATKFVYLTQGDQSGVGVYIAKSFHIEPGAAVTVSSGRPLVLVSLSTFLLQGSIDVSADDLPGSGGPGGFSSGTSDTVGLGLGGGSAGTDTQAGGGGSYCGVGGAGNNVTPGGATNPGGAAWGTQTLTPLIGGSSGGSGAQGAGGGGGALQLVAGTSFTLDSGGKLAAGGGPGNESGDSSQQAGGGGSGGAILIEAPTVSIAGTISVNGGGGGGPGGDGTYADFPLSAAMGGGPLGGAGSAGTSIGGVAGLSMANSDPGAGGGGAGRVRINSTSGHATISGTISPDVSTMCVTQGTLASK